MTELPSGTVTFLFTDLEGSTRLWDEHPDAMRVALARHDELVRDAVAGQNGVVVKGTGDGVHAAFATAPDAIGAAVAAQLAVAAEPWHQAVPLRVRMGIHSGEAELRDGDYFGSALNRAARLMSVAHGEQIVCSQATADLARDSLPPEVALADLGEHRLRDLARPERVFQVCAPGLPHRFTPLRTGEATPGNLPRQVTTFVGRERELHELGALVTTRPLVTLTGVGGVGKTRLALEVAATAADEFPDGAWLCELAPVIDPDAVFDALAATFRVVPSPGRRLDEVLVEYLASKRALVVLDNCEHLLDAAANLVTLLRRDCPDVAVIATSREGLASPGEQLVAVPSLPLPAPGAAGEALGEAASVRLFLDRARAVKHDFAPTASTLDAVADLCRRLDGIPLAIELAAARVASLSPEDLVQRLDHRFRLLTRGSRASLERHQTLRNTIDWSYDLLDEGEQVALQRLAVFAGGGGLDALESVLSAGDGLDAYDVIDTVGRLVDKSLVVADPDTDGRLRYRMLETIRQYAQERLEAGGDLQAVRAAHAEYYAGFAEEAGPHLRNRDLPVWSPRAAREIDNFRIVVDWAIETTQPEVALRVVAPLRGHGHPAGYSATDWAESTVEIPGAEDHAQFLAVASWAVFGATMRGDLSRASKLAARIEQIQRERGAADPTAYQGLGTLAFFQSDLERAREIAERWVSAARGAGDGYELAHALVLWASTEQFLGLPTARAHMEEAVRVARDTGTLSALAIALSVLVNMLDPDAGETEHALELTEEAIAVTSQLDDQIASGVAGGTRGMLLAVRGNYRDALGVAQRAAQVMRSANSVAALAPIAVAAAVACAELGERQSAAMLFGVADRLSVASSGWWIERRLRDVETALRADLGADFAPLFDRGAALDSNAALSLVADLEVPDP